MKLLIPLLAVVILLVGAKVYVTARNNSRAVAASPAATTQPLAAPTTRPATQPVAALKPWAPNGAINHYCAVQTDDEIDPQGKTYVYKGKTIGFCCPDCVSEFKKDPEKYMAKLH